MPSRGVGPLGFGVTFQDRLHAVSTQNNPATTMVLLRLLDLPRLSAAFVVITLLGGCLAGPAHHGSRPQRKDSVALQGLVPAISPSSSDSIKPPTLVRRAQGLEPVRLVQYLRETINLAGPNENDDDHTYLWRIYLEHVSQFLFNPALTIDPIGNVAFKLERLYDLAAQALYEIIETHDYPEDNSDNEFSLRLGQVAIEWGCRTGPLCWHLLYDFCLLMQQKARQGWTGMYNGQLINVGTGVVTWVRLTIRGGRGGGGIALPKRESNRAPFTVRNVVLA